MHACLDALLHLGVLLRVVINRSLLCVHKLVMNQEGIDFQVFCGHGHDRVHVLGQDTFQVRLPGSAASIHGHHARYGCVRSQE